MSDGGYDEGYRVCPTFWGEQPAEYVMDAIERLAPAGNRLALDFGCGDGKNAAAMARAGLRVLAIDRSSVAVNNARARYGDLDVMWLVCDLRSITGPARCFDLIVATGSLHCLESESEIIQALGVMKAMTKDGGFNVISAFNDGNQDMSGHSADFRPTFLPHANYVAAFSGWRVIRASSEYQVDRHPHNDVEHGHSISRLLVQKEQ